jgi:hypothetical protein
MGLPYFVRSGSTIPVPSGARWVVLRVLNGVVRLNYIVS